MRPWKETICIAAAVLTLCAAAVLLFGNRKECCLCNSPRYSAPCLIDLETGAILELNLDGPSATYDGNGQSDVETFSFIRFGNVTGTKQTAPSIIELKIPATDKSNNTALCNNCRKLLPRGYDGRCALADLKNRTFFPFTAGEIKACDLSVTMTQENDYFLVIVR